MELCYRTSHQSYKSFTSACEPGGFEALQPADFSGGFKAHTELSAAQTKFAFPYEFDRCVLNNNYKFVFRYSR